MKYGWPGVSIPDIYVYCEQLCHKFIYLFTDYSFPYIIIIGSIVSVAIHMAFQLGKYSVPYKLYLLFKLFIYLLFRSKADTVVMVVVSEEELCYNSVSLVGSHLRHRITDPSDQPYPSFAATVFSTSSHLLLHNDI